MNNFYKSFLVTEAVTFVTAFAVALAALLKAGAVTPDNIGWSVLGSVLFAALRAAVQALTQGVVLPVAGKIKASFAAPTLEK